MPRPPSGLIPVGYRDLPEQIARVDLVAESIAPEGSRPSRSDAVRVLVSEALAARDAKTKASAPKPGPRRLAAKASAK